MLSPVVERCSTSPAAHSASLLSLGYNSKSPIRLRPPLPIGPASAPRSPPSRLLIRWPPQTARSPPEGPLRPLRPPCKHGRPACDSLQPLY
eukprot:1194060-Prorocentrum_minimum.AAC.1